MIVTEIRDLDDARRYLLQGFWLQRVAKPHASRFKGVCEWAHEILSEGHPLPPLGLVADVGHVAYGIDPALQMKDAVGIPGWSSALGRSYEDHVLGKVYADWTFERASDAVRRYEPADRARGLAFIIRRYRERADLGGVEMSPAVVRGLLNLDGTTMLAEGMESFSRDGPHPVLVKQYEELVSATRKMAEILGPEDVIALEHRTALADMSRYVAHRQILQITARLEARLPPRPVRPLTGRKEVPTRVLDEDQYPVGGYTSISNRGSIESLLHSQLAYMEDQESPDLFDLKFVRDELFYYSRDENQFLRRRRTFIFVLGADLLSARFKDGELPCQRIVLACAVVLATVRRMADWLSTDALRFELLFVTNGDKATLDDECELFRILLRELIETGIAVVETVPDVPTAVTRCSRASRQAQVQVLQLSAKDRMPEPEGAVLTTLVVNAVRPTLLDGFGDPVFLDTDDNMEAWSEAVRRVLELWI